jgi:predicted ATPase
VQPLLVIFENLHWLDGETQAFLDSPIESLPAARMLLMVNYRPETIDLHVLLHIAFLRRH